MNIPLHIALAAAALVWGGILTAGHAQGQERAFEPARAGGASFRNVRAAVPANPPLRALTAKERQDGFERLCWIKPVMTDLDLAGCKRAFELY